MGRIEKDEKDNISVDAYGNITCNTKVTCSTVENIIMYVLCDSCAPSSISDSSFAPIADPGCANRWCPFFGTSRVFREEIGCVEEFDPADGNPPAVLQLRRVVQTLPCLKVRPRVEVPPENRHLRHHLARHFAGGRMPPPADMDREVLAPRLHLAQLLAELRNRQAERAQPTFSDDGDIESQI